MVRVLLSRRIFRTLDPPLDHGSVHRRATAAAAPLCSRGRKAQVSLLVCSDRAIEDLNREWLGRDRPTSVIAFPSPALAAHTGRTGPLDPSPGVLDDLVPPGSVPLHLGDIAVSVDTARREATSRGRSIKAAPLSPPAPLSLSKGRLSRGDERVVYLALHGLLHLIGWDHDDDRSWRAMHRATLRLLEGPCP